MIRKLLTLTVLGGLLTAGIIAAVAYMAARDDYPLEERHVNVVGHNHSTPPNEIH